MKIVTVVGARPQFIKASVISRVMHSIVGLEEVLVHTGQHYDDNMSNIFFDELEIPKPDYYLGIGSGSHGAQTGRMLEAIEHVLLNVEPDWLLVYGDTNSTLAGALAAAKLHIPVAHVEAGLRSFNRLMPEEMNRVLTDHVSNLLLAPTQASVENLLREGIQESYIHLVGDVMYDTALYYGDKSERESRVLEMNGLKPKGYILTTIHRAENTDNSIRLRAIFEGLIRINEEIPVVMPLHPRTLTTLQREGMMEEVSRHIQLIEPVGYLDMVVLEKNARLITTDSGGVQKEAFFHRVPCVTIREETEWIELVDLKWNRLSPPRTGSDLVKDISDVLMNPLGMDGTPYGDGRSAERIVNCLLEGMKK